MQVHAATPPRRLISVDLGGNPFRLLFELAVDTQTQQASSVFRISTDDVESVFGRSEVQIAIVSGQELRYVYANESYRRIRPGVTMIGRTYRQVFPEAAEAGAEARLQCVIDTSETWIVDDYPTLLPERDFPAWWQGQCVPIEVGSAGRPDAALIILWDVTARHLPGAGPLPKSEGSLRIEAAKAKLTAQMASLGLFASEGWRISEEVRETDTATVWTLRPIHLHLPSPTSVLERVEFRRTDIPA